MLVSVKVFSLNFGLILSSSGYLFNPKIQFDIISSLTNGLAASWINILSTLSSPLLFVLL